MMRRLFGALGVLILLSAQPASANKEKARDYYRKGMAKYVLDKWDAAIHEFELGFQEEPEPAFLYNIAQAHRQAKRTPDAIAYYRKYLDLAPEAKDRREVEKTIAELEKELKPEPRESEFAAMPDDKPLPRRAVPAAALTSAGPPVVEKPHARRWPIWVGIAAGVVVAGAATAIAIVATRAPAEPTIIWNDRQGP